MIVFKREMEKGRQKITQNPSCGRIILNSTFTLCESQILLNIETRGKQKKLSTIVCPKLSFQSFLS